MSLCRSPACFVLSDHEFERKIHMLAYIHWTTNVKEDSVGLLSFSRFGAYEFINACAIDHCVGFFNCNEVFYIIDKEDKE